MNRLNLNKNDILVLITLFLVVLISSTYPMFPYVAASLAILGYIAAKLMNAPSEDETKRKSETKTTAKPEPTPATAVNQSHQTPEQRSVEQIIVDKLNNGAIERAMEKRFDKMVDNIVDDLFGNYGDISREIKSKLREQMSAYIEQVDFSQYNTKLEHLLNEIIKNVTSEQGRVVKNIKEIMGVKPISKIKTSELFDKYTDFIGSEIDTSKLEINTDDTPSYEPLTASMTYSKDHLGTTSMSEKAILTFTCEEDEKFNIKVKLRRWADSILGNDWQIEEIRRTTGDGETIYAFQTGSSEKEITSLELPLNNLRDMNDFEVFLLKLHYDRTTIEIDERDIHDEEVEVKAEPEYTLF